MTDKLAGYPTPVVTADPHGEQVVAQLSGEAVPEPPHRRMEEQMTPDKVPNNAPLWYQLVVNGSTVTIICAVFLVNQFNQPSATQLIDRTLAGQDKLLDRQEKINDIYKEAVRARGLQVDRVVESYEKAMREAKDYHDSAKKERADTKVMMEELVKVNTRAALALDRIAEKK